MKKSANVRRELDGRTVTKEFVCGGGGDTAATGRNMNVRKDGMSREEPDL